MTTSCGLWSPLYNVTDLVEWQRILGLQGFLVFNPQLAYIKTVIREKGTRAVWLNHMFTSFAMGMDEFWLLDFSIHDPNFKMPETMRAMELFHGTAGETHRIKSVVQEYPHLAKRRATNHIGAEDLVLVEKMQSQFNLARLNPLQE